MKHEIRKREMSWGVLFELYMEGSKSPTATLTLDERSAFGEPQAPNINWSAVGSRTIEMSKAFAAGLLDLAAIADSPPPT